MGRQVGSRPSHSGEVPIVSTNAFVNQQHPLYVSPSQPSFLFSHPYHHFGAPIQSTLSSQPPTMPGMPQFPLPFHLPHVSAQFQQSWPHSNEAGHGRQPQPKGNGL
jgi:hypothetical protein